MKKLLTTLAALALLFLPLTAFATSAVPWSITNLTDTFIFPNLVNGSAKGFIVSASSTLNSIFTVTGAFRLPSLSNGTINIGGGVTYSTATSTQTLGSGLVSTGTVGSDIGGTSGTLSVSGLTTGNFASANISQFTNNSGYLTSAVTSAVAGTGISVSGATGAVTFTNTGVTSIVAGTNITVSGATGAVTVNCPSCGGGGSAYPFPLTGNATSTLTQFNGGLTAFASSTIGNGTIGGGLTINGNATTTSTFQVGVGLGTLLGTNEQLIVNQNGAAGIAVHNSTAGNEVGIFAGASGDGSIGSISNNDFKFQTNNKEVGRFTTTGNLGVGSSSPFAKLSVQARATDTNTVLFAIGSSTASATSTLFTVTNTGLVGIGATPTGARLEVQGTTTDATGNVFIGWDSSGKNIFNIANNGSTTISNFGACNTTSALTTTAAGTIICGAITGGGGVSSVSNADGTLTISPTTGSVVASLALGHANTWSALQTFGNATSSLFSTTYGSTTNDFVGTLNLPGIPTCNTTSALTTTGGVVSCGSISGGGGSAYPFGLTGNATSTLTQFNGGLTAFGSTTIGNGTVTGGLTVSGMSTTTGKVLHNADVAFVGQAVFDSGGFNNTGTVINISQTNFSMARGFNTVLAWQADFNNTGGFNPEVQVGDNTPIAFFGTSVSGTPDINLYRTGVNQLTLASSAGGSNGGPGGAIFGIGTTSPNAELALHLWAGKLPPGNNAFLIASSTNSATSTLLNVTNTGAIFAPLTASSGASQTGYWCYDANGQFIRDTAVCLVSAARYKQDITPIASTDALSEVLKLQPVSFYYKPDFNGSFQSNPNYSSEQVGFTADQVETVDPRLVVVETATTTFEGKTYPPGTVQTVRYDQMSAVLAGAIQQLNTKIDNINIGKVTKSAQDNWQDVAILLLTLWCLYLTFKKK